MNDHPIHPNGTIEMASDVNLQVGFLVFSVLTNHHLNAPSSNQHRMRKLIVFGSRHVENVTFKASSKPFDFEIYLGNPDVGTSLEKIADFVVLKKYP